MNAAEATPASDLARELRERAERIKQSWALGAAPDTPAALAHAPDLRGDKSVVLDLAYEEYCLRREAGEALTPDEFCDRFPAFRTSLRRLLEVDQCLEAQEALLAAPLPEWPEPGRRLGDFTLVRELGRGGFARVFLAREASAGNRFVAVKLTRERTAEAGTLGPLFHDNVVQVLSARPDPGPDGFAVVCMRFAGAATLNDLLDRAFPKPDAPPPTHGRVVLEAIRATVRAGDPVLKSGPVPDVLTRGTYVAALRDVACQIAEGLDFLHGHGIYHRDLKPSNVLLDNAGRPLLLDFNLCANEQYAAPRLGGTVPYMAPEQLSAVAPGARDTQPPDGRADLFSLGVILYELLTGKHPFGPVPLDRPPAELIGWLRQRQRRGCRPLRELNRQVDRPLAALIHRCLALDPAYRPATAAEVVDELKRQDTRAGRRRLLLGLGGLVFGGAALAGARALLNTPLPPPSPAPRSPFEEGKDAFEAGDYARAEKCFQRAVAADAGSAVDWFALGRARLKQALDTPGGEGRTKANLAHDAFMEAYQRRPDGACEACLAYCQARLGSTNNYELALMKSARALRAGFRTAGLLNNHGFVYRQKSKLAEALRHFDDALALGPELRAARFNRAVTLLTRRVVSPRLFPTLPRQALEDIRQALDSGPVTADLAYRAGCIYAQAAHDGLTAGEQTARLQEQALTYLRQAVSLGFDPQRFDPRHPSCDAVLLSALGSHPDFPTLRKVTRGEAGPQQELGLADPLSGLLPS